MNPHRGTLNPFLRDGKFKLFSKAQKRARDCFCTRRMVKKGEKESFFFEKIGGGHVRKWTLLHFCPKANFKKFTGLKLKHCT